MGLRRGGLFLIPASAHSLTPTLKLICSLLTFFLEKITHKLIDQSKRFGSGRELSDFRELGTNHLTECPLYLLGCIIDERNESEFCARKICDCILPKMGNLRENRTFFADSISNLPKKPHHSELREGTCSFESSWRPPQHALYRQASEMCKKPRTLAFDHFATACSRHKTTNRRVFDTPTVKKIKI